MKKWLKNLTKGLCGVAFVLALPACGEDEANFSGVFIDSPVGGLSYETPSQTGISDQQGSFSYQPGEEIRFFLGDISLGQATAQTQLSPFDLVPAASAIVEAREIRKLLNDLRKGAVTPMEQVIQRAVFLQSLDEDGDLKNGIVIPEALSGLAQGASVDFEENLRFGDSSFFAPGQAGLRRLMSAGFAQGIWNGSKAIQTPGRALDHLYSSLELIPEIDLWTYYSVDADGDGVANFVRTRQFDEKGRLIREEYDNGADGDIDLVQTITYDDADRPLRLESDVNQDGIVDVILEQQYNDRGQLVRSMESDVAVGVLYINELTYNELGYPIQSVWIEPDGSLDSIDSYTYDDKGHLVQIAEDTDADGVAESIDTYQYDERGNLIRQMDGNTVVAYIYDENNNLLRRENDFDGDGTADSSLASTYDELGNLLREERDNDGDGIPNSVKVFQNDELGNRIRMEADNDFDGVLDRIENLSYDERGNLIATEATDGAGNPDDRHTYGDFQSGNWVSFFQELDELEKK